MTSEASENHVLETIGICPQLLQLTTGMQVCDTRYVLPQPV